MNSSTTSLPRRPPALHARKVGTLARLLSRSPQASVIGGRSTQIGIGLSTPAFIAFIRSPKSALFNSTVVTSIIRQDYNHVRRRRHQQAAAELNTPYVQQCYPEGPASCIAPGIFVQFPGYGSKNPNYSGFNSSSTSSLSTVVSRYADTSEPLAKRLAKR